MTGASGFAQDILKLEQNCLSPTYYGDCGFGAGSCVFGRGSDLCPGRGYGDYTRFSESVRFSASASSQKGCWDGQGEADGTGHTQNHPRLSWYIIRR